MDIHALLSGDSIAGSWSSQMRDLYLRFYQRLSQGGPLSVRIGTGGLSFYKEVKGRSVFVCHFNAHPQRGREDLGFADFRFDALRPYLDTNETLQRMQQAADQEIRVKANKVWCSLHFPLARADEVADLFKDHILARIPS